jgi:hypothetical protein
MDRLAVVSECRQLAADCRKRAEATIDEAEQLGASARMNEWERKMMMRALFLRVAIGTCTAISLGASAANAQSVKPKYPGEIAAASERAAQRNEDCRRESSICVS